MDQATHSKIVSFLWKKIRRDILAMQKEAEGLLEELISEPRASASGVSK
jgi:hypothetical protein